MTLNYIFETTICWLFFYLLYALWLRKETLFRANRIYLIGTLLLGFLIPAIDFIPTQQPIVIQDFTVYLNEVTVLAKGNAATADTGFNIGEILIAMYKFGVAVFLLRFFIGMGGILRLFINSEIIQKENYTLVYTLREHAPFSFMNFFFVSKKMNFSEAEWQQITRHEEAHIRGVHTLDVLLVELLTIIFWFNPLIYMYKHAVRNVHEYLADAAVIKTVPMVHYGRFLVSFALPGFRMANNFNHSQLKKRIAMMTKTQSSKFALAKYILFIPLVFLMLFVFSCKDDSVKHLEAQVDTQSKKQVVKEGNWKEVSEAIKNDKTATSKKSKIFGEDGKLLGEMTFQDKGSAKKSEEVVAYETDAKTGKIVKVESSENVKKLVKDKANFHQPNEQEVFTIVEEMPRFPGCENTSGTNSKKKECAEGKMLQYIYNNITYPSEAKKLGVQGMTVVSFIVEKDGRITEPKILRSTGHGTDEVVLNMVNNMPTWTPGRQAGKTVRVKFNLPVRFKLEG